MEIDAQLDRLLQLFVADRQNRIRAEKTLKATQRKEEEAAKALAELVRQRTP